MLVSQYQQLQQQQPHLNFTSEFSRSPRKIPGTDFQYCDLVFLSEGVFAVANIFSFMRLVTLATLSQQIGESDSIYTVKLARAKLPAMAARKLFRG